MPARPASLLTPRPIHWLWPQFLARGKLALLDGDPGLGKSWLTLDLAARLSTTRPWPDQLPTPAEDHSAAQDAHKPAGESSSLRGPDAPQQPENATARNPLSPAAGERGRGAGVGVPHASTPSLAENALLFSAEDNDADTLAPRLKSLGADLARVFLWPSTEPPPQLPSQLPLVEAAIRAARPALIVFDPFAAFLDPALTLSTDERLRRLLHSLSTLAEKYDAAMLLIRHLNKKSDANPLYRGSGAIALIAACRLAHLVARHPEDPARSILAPYKNNLAPLPPSLTFRLNRPAGESSSLRGPKTARRRRAPTPQLAICNRQLLIVNPRSIGSAHPLPRASDLLRPLPRPTPRFPLLPADLPRPRPKTPRPDHPPKNKTSPNAPSNAPARNSPSAPTASTTPRPSPPTGSSPAKRRPPLPTSNR
ncbi:MAG: AAA family ATPase [Gemmataceae bacterium]